MPQNSTSDNPSSFVCALRQPLLWLGLIWAAMAVATWPSGEFPLNDDWSYSLPVRSILEEGRLRLCGWTSMPLIAQVAWGALFCAPFGFSHMALRISTLALGFLALAATYGFAREAGASRKDATFIALALAVNPVFFSLANTFMTDVPFLSTTMASLFLLARGMNKAKPGLLAAGIFSAAVATLIRQTGLVIPIAFCVTFLWKNRPVNRRHILVCIASIAAVALPLLIYNRLLNATGNVPEWYHARTTNLLERLHAPVANAGFWAGNLAASAVYLGLFLLPTILATQQSTSGSWLRRHITAILLALVTTALLYLTGTLMPFFGNILYNLGLGPICLYDVYTLELQHWPAVPVWIRVCVTFGAVLATAYMLPGLFLQCRNVATPEHRPTVVLAGLSASLYLPPLIAAGMFDRYLLLLIPLLGAIMCAGSGSHDQHATPLLRGAAVLVLLSFLAFSVCATRDYFAWNRARWEAARDLLEKQHVPWSKIDGGFEFNGLYGYHPAHDGRPSSNFNAKRSWWWIEDDEYILAMGPVPGYDVETEYRFARIIPPGHGAILVLHRKSADQP